MSLSTQDRFAYFKNQDAERVARSAIETGKAEGKAEGEAQKAIAVARVLLAEGMSATIIAKATGLTIEEIKKLI